MPEVSIVMTVFNGEQFIDAAMRSALEQTMADFEIILVDDGSTDSTPLHIARFSDPRLRVVRTEHEGRAHALNVALDNTRAELIAFLDADDVALPQRLERQKMHVMSGIDVVGSWYKAIDADGALLYEQRFPTNSAAITEHMPVECSVSFGTAMMTRSAIDRIGRFEERLKAAVDYDFWLRALGRCTFANIPACLTLVRMHPTSLSQRKRTLQLSSTYTLSREYLEQHTAIATTQHERSRFDAQRMRLEYYHGSLAEARRIGRRLLSARSGAVSTWRYYLAACLGRTLLGALRRSAIVMRLARHFRNRRLRNSSSPKHH